MRRRIAWPRMGAAPSVEMPTTTGERLTMAPNWKSQKAGLSMTLTGTPAARAAACRRPASASSAASITAMAAPSSASGRRGQRLSTTRPGPTAPAARRSDLLVRLLGANSSTSRTRRRQQLRLPGHAGRAADDHDPPAVQVEEDRQLGQGRHARRRDARGLAAGRMTGEDGVQGGLAALECHQDLPVLAGAHRVGGDLALAVLEPTRGEIEAPVVQRADQRSCRRPGRRPAARPGAGTRPGWRRRRRRGCGRRRPLRRRPRSCGPRPAGSGRPGRAAILAWPWRSLRRHRTTGELVGGRGRVALQPGVAAWPSTDSCIARSSSAAMPVAVVDHDGPDRARCRRARRRCRCAPSTSRSRGSTA